MKQGKSYYKQKSAGARDLGTDVHPANLQNSHGRTALIVPAKTELDDGNCKKSDSRFAFIQTVARIEIEGNKACPACLISWASDVQRRRGRRNR